MVYRGKPSRSCLHCRRRKLKCDLAEGSCGQCIRGHLVCPGYRDITQLRIQDESQSVKQKAMARRIDALPFALEVSIDEKARNAFFSHYVSGFSKTYDILEWLYNPAEAHLAASVDAVSLAVFASQFYHTGCLRNAQHKYSYALRLLNQALQSPEIAKSDTTLLAVLFLDLFEKIVHKDTKCSEAWMSHVNGALALIKMRGHSQLASHMGTRLSMKLATNLIVSCIAASLEAPLGLIKLRYDLEPFLDQNDPKWRITSLVTRYGNLRAAIRKNALSNDDIISEAIYVDHEFIYISQDMPSSWHYETERLEKSSTKALEQHFDVYPDHYICQTWNVLRIIRIMLNDIIRKHSKPSGPIHSEMSEYSLRSEVATVTIDSIAYQICASVPQFTRLLSNCPTDTLASATQRLRCHTLLFPLYVAGSLASPSTNIKNWVLDQLDCLSANFGMQNSALVAKILKTAPETCPWTVHTFLGSYAFSA